LDKKKKKKWIPLPYEKLDNASLPVQLNGGKLKPLDINRHGKTALTRDCQKELENGFCNALTYLHYIMNHLWMKRHSKAKLFPVANGERLQLLLVANQGVTAIRAHHFELVHAESWTSSKGLFLAHFAHKRKL
jgi:hypothetical protein